MTRDALSIATIILCLAVSTACQEPPDEVPAADPISTLGHGVFFGPGGEPVTVTLELIRDAQSYHIAALERSASSEARATRETIDGLVDDEVLANALYLDWLIDAAEPRDRAHVVSVNNALRWRYVYEFQRDPVLPQDGAWWRGLRPEIARQLEDRGIQVFLQTNAAGSAYREECRRNGVPVPDAMFSSAWDFRGVVDNDFLTEPDSQAELWRFTSDSPAGVCLALPRYDVVGGTVGDDAEVLGIICLGTQTSKACFFDNPNMQSFERNVEVPINQFLGGTDLTTNGQGVCSDCHAGENPFVVHRDKAAFSGLTPSLLPLAWHDPLVDPSWPQNPGPTTLLDAVSSTGRCDTCHRVGVAGRFPEVSNQLSGYCRDVLATAMGTTAKRTMPPPPGSPRAPYLDHIQALQNACAASPSIGVVVDFDVPDDPAFVSPPIVIDPPLYRCATKVAVRSAKLDAELTLFVNGTAIDTVIVRNPNLEEFDIPALAITDGVPDVVTAQQNSDGVLSALSAPVTVRDHTADFPAGLPTPEIAPTLIHECAEVIAVRQVPGATVTVFSNGVDPRSGSGSTDWTVYRPAKRPFEIGDTFTAQQSLCDENSGVSAGVSAVAEPTSIPAPTFNPPETYAGQELVTVETLVNGSRTTVSKVGSGLLGDFTTPVSWKPDYDVATLAGGSLAAGDRLSAQQVLCTAGPPTETPPAEECSALPAPRIAHPLVGQTFVVVTRAVPGATIRVYDATNDELGDGAGTVVVLKRAITGTDTLTAVQQVGRCTSSTGYRVSVRNPGSQQPD